MPPDDPRPRPQPEPPTARSGALPPSAEPEAGGTPPGPSQPAAIDAGANADKLRAQAVALRKQADVLEDRAELADGVGRTHAAEDARREASALLIEAQRLDDEAARRDAGARADVAMPTIDPRLRQSHALLEVSRNASAEGMPITETHASGAAAAGPVASAASSLSAAQPVALAPGPAGVEFALSEPDASPKTQPSPVPPRAPAPAAIAAAHAPPQTTPAPAPVHVPQPMLALQAPRAAVAGALGPGANAANAAPNAQRTGATNDLVLPGDWSHYEVLGVLGEGGMGRVFRVRHRAWDLDMVVKVPRGSMLQRPGFLAALVGEAEAWAGLGLHPNVVTCYYARVHRGVPWLFAEFVDGGSLTDWIRTRRLYDPPHALARLLDVAIQIARGLDHAHERGLIHQDIKPANILMTSEGTAKVTDFGLSRAAHLGLSVTAGAANETLISEYGGMTPAYASPEQMQAARDGRVPLTRRTDAWSWALTVLEMFNGRLTWNDGRQASALLEQYLRAPRDQSRPFMPEALVALLRRCFAPREYDRPTSLREVADALCEVYPEVTGRPAPHTLRAGSDPADVLFNRGASYDDLGDRDRALALWSEALELEPHHPHATYARALTRWRRGEITDADAVRELLEASQSHPDSWQVPWLLAWLHAERGDDAAARECVASAKAIARDDAAAARAISRVEAAIRPALFRRAELPRPLHAGPIAVSGDGRIAVLSGYDAGGVPMLYPCDTGSGRVLSMVPVPHAPEEISLSEDGRFALMVGTYRATAIDLATGTPGFAIGSSVRTPWVALSGDGARFAILLEGRGELRATADGRLLWASPLAPAGSWALMTADATLGRVALVDARGNVFAYQTMTGAELGRWELGVAITGLEFLRDGSLVAAWWDAAQSLGRMARLAAPVNNDRGISAPTQSAAAAVQLALGPGPWTVLQVSTDGVLRRWDLAQRRCVSTGGYVGYTAPVRQVVTSREGTVLVTSHADGAAFVYAANPTLAWAPVPVTRPGRAEDVLARRAAFEASLQYARSMASRGDWSAAIDALSRSRAIPGFARSPDARALWWRLSEHARRGRIGRGWSEAEIADLRAPVQAVEIDPRGEVICGTVGDHEVRVWDAGSGAPLRALTHTGPVCAMGMAPRGGWVLTAEPGWLRLFRYDSGVCVHAVRMAGSPVSVSLAADARHASAVTAEGVGVWDLATGALVTAAPVAGARRASVSDDATLLLVVPASGPAALWDVHRSCWVRRFVCSADALDAVLTPDGRTVLVGCNDGALRVWDVLDGSLRSQLVHEAPVTGVAVSFDGLLAVTTDARGAVRVWDLDRMAPSAWLSGHASSATDVALTPCGRRAVTGGRDGFVRVWRLEWELRATASADASAAIEYDDAWPWVRRFLSRGGANVLGSVPPGVAPSELLRELSWAGYGNLSSRTVREMVDALLRGDPQARRAAGSTGTMAHALDEVTNPHGSLVVLTEQGAAPAARADGATAAVIDAGSAVQHHVEGALGAATGAAMSAVAPAEYQPAPSSETTDKGDGPGPR